jgi:hypothetical protein
MMIGAFSPALLARHRADVRDALSNPGFLYNAGNLMTFVGSVILFVVVSGGSQGLTLNGFAAHFLGNWPAALTTLATIIFWTSGMKYAAAWSHGFPPDQRLNGAGHAISTLGALTIGVALIGLARTEVALALALIATILHAGGKMVSWLAPQDDCYFKPMPLYSRIPYVTTLCLDMRSDLLTSATAREFASKITLPVFLLVATLFWARADWLLLPKAKP